MRNTVCGYIYRGENFPLNRFLLSEYLYISILISKSSIFWLFTISRLSLIFYPYSEFRFGFNGKFYTGCSVLKIFFILLFERVIFRIVDEKTKKWRKIFIGNRLFLRIFHFNFVSNANIFKKSFKALYSVEFKSKLRIGVKNKGKPWNQK